MAKSASIGIWASLGAAMVVLGVVAYQSTRPDMVTNFPVETDQAQTIPAETSQADDETVSGVATDATTTPASTETAQNPEVEVTAPPTQAPALDVVRVERDGAALLAGRAADGAEVTLQLDGEEIARVQADADGNFVSMLDLPQSDTPQVLTVDATQPDGTQQAGAEAIIIAPGAAIEADTAAAPEASTQAPETTEPETAVAETTDTATLPGAADSAPSAEVAALPDPVETATAPEPQTEPPQPSATELAQAAIPEATGAPASPPAPVTPGAETRPAPRIFRAGPDGLRLDAAPQDAAPKVTQSLGLDAIAYGAGGEVQLTGTGAADTRLQVYLDNRPVQTIAVGDGGTWASPLPDIDAGVYTLRIDAISREGSVVSRIETPFKRTAPEIAAAARAEGAQALTVQPGFTLWAISEGYFGDGLQYVQLFQANRDLIRDPDLIYPGQVLALPGDEG